MIESSDVEGGDVEGGDISLENQSASTSIHNIKISSDSDEAAKVQGGQEAVKKPTSSTSGQAHSVGVICEENALKSESELSVLVDEPPKRSKKSKSKDKESGKSAKETKQKKKNPAVGLSKDEEAVKRLKSLVVACGVRKVWKKEFQDMDTPSQQIKRVREILAGLGMSGRFSLEQAKAIRAKRELAQELEDVQSFEKTVVSGQSSHSQVKSKQTQRDSVSEDESENDSEAPKKRRNTARLSIMAFLGDQSSED